MASMRLLTFILSAVLSLPVVAAARTPEVAQLASTAASLVEQGRDSMAAEKYRAALALAPDDIPLHRDYQDLMRNSGFGTDMVQEYATALKAAPESADALYLYGRASGDPTAAGAAFEKALQNDPRHVWARQGMGGVAAVQGRLSDALAELDAAATLASDRPAIQAEVYNKIANVQLAQGEFESALTSWKMAMRLDPDDYHAYQNMGAALSVEGRTEEAAEQLATAVQKAPGRRLVHINYAYVLFKLQRLDLALAHFEAALALNPRDRAVASSRDLVRSVQEGEIPFSVWVPYEKALGVQLTDPAAAAQHYREVLLLAPGFSAAHMNLGLALYAQGKKEEARKSLMTAVEYAPKDPGALFNAGSVALAEGDAAEAERLLNRAHQLDPQDHEIILALALTSMALGRRGDADSWFLKGLEIRPRDPILWMQFGGAQAAGGDFKAAEHKFRKALEIAPLFIAARVQLVALLRQDLRYDEALAEIAIIEEAVPNHPDVTKERIALESARAARAKAAEKGGIHVSQILISDRKRAEKVLGDLRSGLSWELLARNYGEGPEAQRAGDVGYVDPADVRPEIAVALGELKSGETSGLVAVSRGWLILKRLP
jgi:tetratricopeptide (TPR) repeat protein